MKSNCEKNVIHKKTWKEFRDTGLLVFVNQFLHIFGWAIAVNVNEDGEVTEAYPVRTAFRGFSEDITDKAYEKVSYYMREHANEINNETFCGFLTEEES